MTAQERVHRQLAARAWPGPGMSPTNRFICALIVISSAFAIVETEATIVELAPRFFVVAEIVFGVLFLCEYLTRLYAVGADPRYAGAVGRVRYALTPMALIDLCALLPLLLTSSANPMLLRLCRLIRILRLAKLGRYSLALQHLGEAMHMRRHELALSVLLILLVLIVSSTLVYFAEADEQPKQFGSIPRALWWAIVTLTTVGYGDVYPVTTMGRIFAGVTALAGVGLIAIPTGILASAFSDVFQRSQREHEARVATASDPQHR
jgi:voltage-gated potassium channel